MTHNPESAKRDISIETKGKAEFERFRETSLLALPLSDFVGDLDKRWKTIGPFLGGILDKYKKPKVLDLAMGSGQDTLSLKDVGFEVASNEIDPSGISAAQANAQQRKTSLDLRNANWQTMNSSEQYKPEEFNVLFSLGNSFPNYLLREEDRINALQNFWRLLKSQGTLIFDTRNFDYMIQSKDQILSDPENKFAYSYNNTYIGRDVKGFPIAISPEVIRMAWKNYKTMTYAQLDVWPATIQNVQELIKKSIGEVDLKILYDYKETKPENFDFVQYVLTKANYSIPKAP